MNFILKTTRLINMWIFNPWGVDTAPTVIEGNENDNNKLIFRIESSTTLQDNESITLNLNIEDMSTDWSDYGYLSEDTITLNASNQFQEVTLEIFGDTEVEPNEELWLNASVVNKVDVDEVHVIPGLGTINNDDGNGNDGDDNPDDQITIELGTASSSEGDSGVQTTGIEVYLTGGSLSEDITIDLSSGDSVTIPSGSTSETAQVEWSGDTESCSMNNFELDIREVA